MEPHYQLRGRRILGPLTPIQKAKWWLRSGTGTVDDAIKLLRSQGFRDEQIQSEFGQDILVARRRELKGKGYSDDEVNEFMGSGDIFGGVGPIKRMFVHSSIVLKRSRRRNEIAQEGTSKKGVEMQDEKSSASPTSKTPEPKVFSRNGIKGVLVAFGFLMLLFPPWTNTFTRPGSAVAKSPAGYGFIFSPPQPQYEGPVFGVELDIKRLAIQFMLLAGAFGVLMFASKKEDA